MCLATCACQAWLSSASFQCPWLNRSQCCSWRAPAGTWCSLSCGKVQLQHLRLACYTATERHPVLTRLGAFSEPPCLSTARNASWPRCLKTHPPEMSSVEQDLVHTAESKGLSCMCCTFPDVNKEGP